LRAFGATVTLTLPALSRKKRNPSRGRWTAGGDHRLLSVDALLQALLDVLADALHDAPSRALAGEVDPAVVGVAHEPMPAPLQLPVEVVQHDVAEQRRKRRPLRGSLVRRVYQPAIHDARFQVASDQLEHLLVVDPSGDPRHQRVVPNPIEERVEIKVDAPRRVISDELACPLDRIMRRAPRPVAEAVGMEHRIEDRREHLQDGLADHPIHRSRHPQHPQTTRGLGDHHPPDRLRPVGARVKRRADLQPMAVQPRPQLLRAHPVNARGTSVLLDASERQREILAGEQLLPQARQGGVRSGAARRRGWTLPWTGSFGPHPPALPPRPLTGLAAFNVHPTSTGVLRLGFAFGPSRRPTIPPVIRPLLTSPRRAAPSRAPPSHPTRRTRQT
jgi:hypothetical protein